MRRSRTKPIGVETFTPLLAASPTRLELVDGQVVAFAGGSAAHSILALRIAGLLAATVRPPCVAHGADFAVRIDTRATYVFPDAHVTCEPFDPDATASIAPKLVVEVISPESNYRDRVEKLDAYRSIASVEEYLLVDSRKVWVCTYRRFATAWHDAVFGADDSFELYSVGLHIAVSDLYAGTGRVIAP